MKNELTEEIIKSAEHCEKVVGVRRKDRVSEEEARLSMIFTFRTEGEEFAGYYNYLVNFQLCHFCSSQSKVKATEKNKYSINLCLQHAIDLLIPSVGVGMSNNDRKENVTFELLTQDEEDEKP